MSNLFGHGSGEGGGRDGREPAHLTDHIHFRDTLANQHITLAYKTTQITNWSWHRKKKYHDHCCNILTYWSLMGELCSSKDMPLYLLVCGVVCETTTKEHKIVLTSTKRGCLQYIWASMRCTWLSYQWNTVNTFTYPHVQSPTGQ